MDKRMAYSQDALIASYERRRFHGKSGEFINQKELNTIYSLVRECSLENRVVLDSPCGTGRLTHFLKMNGFNAIGLDYSEGMIDRTSKRITVPLVRADMFRLPMKDQSLDCIISLRFMFHYREIEQVIIEIRRVLTDKGNLIFDTFNWSPKSNALFGDKRLFIHPRKKIRRTLEAVGMKIVDERHCFFVSPQIYKLLPLRVVKLLDALEGIAPTWLMARSFWCARK